MGLFKKKPKKQEVCTAVTGKCIAMADVNDPVFSSKALGEGAAIIPSDGTVCAPVDGTLTLVAATGHAFGLTTEAGTEFLVHIGIDTVELNGEGFTVLEQAGTHVKKGQPIVRFDPEFMKKNNKDMTTMVILLNGDTVNLEHVTTEGQVTGGMDTVMVYTN